MHAPSVISLLVSGLAASTVAGFELNAPGASLSRRSVALVAAAVGPALALPADISSIEARHRRFFEHPGLVWGSNLRLTNL